MKKTAKIIALVVCVAILCTAFAGCNSNEKEKTQTDGKNFTFWVSPNYDTMATLESYSDLLFFQEMEKATGVHIDFISPVRGSTGSEAFLTMISAGDLPDMIEYYWEEYSGGPQAAIDDGILIALNDYVEEYAPNFYNYMQGEEGKKRNYSTYLSGTTDQGNYYGFNGLNLGETECFFGLFCRGDLLKKWGMDLPETIDDWTEYLSRAKEEGYEKPITGNAGLLNFKPAHNNTFNTAYDVGKSFYLEGDKVVFAPFQKGYKEYVAQMAEWWKAGYIDPGIITNDIPQIEANIVNGFSVAGGGYIGSTLGTLGAAIKRENPDFEIVPCPYPVPKEGDVSRFQGISVDATTQAIGITPDCGNYEAAVAWCDWRYSDEGVVAQLFGKEGETFTIEEIDGEKHYVYTDKILDYEKAGFSTLNQAMYHYCLPANAPGYGQHEDYLLNYYQQQNQKDALKIWNPNPEEAAKHALPTLAYTTEEQSEITDIVELVEAPLEVFLFDIIMGKKSIDEYEKGMADFAKKGYDRYIEINQAAYDRYLSRRNNIAG